MCTSCKHLQTQHKLSAHAPDGSTSLPMLEHMPIAFSQKLPYTSNMNSMP